MLQSTARCWNALSQYIIFVMPSNHIKADNCYCTSSDVLLYGVSNISANEKANISSSAYSHFCTLLFPHNVYILEWVWCKLVQEMSVRACMEEGNLCVGCYLPADDKRVWLSVAGADMPRVTPRHIRWSSAPRSSHLTGRTPPHIVLCYDAERVVGPGRQSDTEITRVPPDVRPRSTPDVRTPRCVVLDDELTHRWIILTEQLPVQLNDSAVTDCPVHVNRSVRNVCRAKQTRHSLCQRLRTPYCHRASLHQFALNAVLLN